MTALDLDTVDFSRGGGTVTVVAQDAATGIILMVAHADREALELTMATGEMHYCSRTRGLWHKGSTSGNVQAVVSLHLDCDGDAVVARVRPAGPACHTGSVSCFGEAVGDAMAEVDAIVAQRAETMAPHNAPSTESYTQRLLGDRNLRLKKLGEECAELVTACADGTKSRAVEEAADLFFHTIVALRSLGAGLSDVQHALDARRRSESAESRRP